MILSVWFISMGVSYFLHKNRTDIFLLQIRYRIALEFSPHWHRTLNIMSLCQHDERNPPIHRWTMVVLSQPTPQASLFYLIFGIPVLVLGGGGRMGIERGRAVTPPLSFLALMVGNKGKPYVASGLSCLRRRLVLFLVVCLFFLLFFLIGWILQFRYLLEQP